MEIWLDSDVGFSRMVPVVGETTIVSADRTRSGSPTSALLISCEYMCMHLRVAVPRTYSSGERDLGRFSGRGQGIVSSWERPIWAVDVLHVRRIFGRI